MITAQYLGVFDQFPGFVKGELYDVEPQDRHSEVVYVVNNESGKQVVLTEPKFKEGFKVLRHEQKGRKTYGGFSTPTDNQEESVKSRAATLVDRLLA